MTRDEVQKLLDGATPGPWHLGPDEDEGLPALLITSQGGRGWSIATAYCGYHAGEADARLITAAPDLARALIEAMDRAEKLGRELNRARYGDPDFSWTIHQDAMADLTARAEAAEAALETAREDALREARDAIADYPRVAPDGLEVQHYDEQIEYCQSIIDALIDKEPTE